MWVGDVSFASKFSLFYAMLGTSSLIFPVTSTKWEVQWCGARSSERIFDIEFELFSLLACV